MRYATYALIAIFTYLLQINVLPTLLSNKWHADLFLVWVIVLTLLQGRRLGFYVALLGGLVYDIIVANYFGLHFFPYILVAYGFGVLGQERFEVQASFAALAVAIGTLLDGMIRILMLYVAKADVHFWSFLWHNTAASILINSLLAYGVYYVAKALEEEEEVIWY